LSSGLFAGGLAMMLSSDQVPTLTCPEEPDTRQYSPTLSQPDPYILNERVAPHLVTVDIRTEVARFGASRHTTGDVRKLNQHFGGASDLSGVWW